jgi:hypothetical protein
LRGRPIYFIFARRFCLLDRIAVSLLSFFSRDLILRLDRATVMSSLACRRRNRALPSVVRVFLIDLPSRYRKALHPSRPDAGLRSSSYAPHSSRQKILKTGSSASDGGLDGTGAHTFEGAREQNREHPFNQKAWQSAPVLDLTVPQGARNGAYQGRIAGSYFSIRSSIASSGSMP